MITFVKEHIMAFKMFLFWESPTTVLHECNGKKHFCCLIICIYFYLICSSTPTTNEISTTIRTTTRFSKPLLCVMQDDPVSYCLLAQRMNILIKHCSTTRRSILYDNSNNSDKHFTYLKKKLTLET